MTNISGSDLNCGESGGNQQGEPITQSYPVSIHERRFNTETEDESKNKDNKREIEKYDARVNRAIKSFFAIATILMAISISAIGVHIAFNHKDVKVREMGISLISAPIAGLFGILAGMAFK